MKNIIIILLLFCFTKVNAQTANAGADQTIYLTNGTTSATLDGSASSGTSYLWSEVSTDYSSGGTITSSTSKTASVTGLTAQGIFYFQIAVTTGVTTHYDTMAVIVNKSQLQSSATYWAGAPFDSLAPTVNNYSDTSINSGGGQWHFYPNLTIYYDRGRSTDMNVDSHNKKFKATVEDGYPWTLHNYGRAELSYGYGDGIGAPVDSNSTYLFEWKGYFPQNEAQSQFTTGGNIFGVTVFMQIHGQDAVSPPFQFLIREDKPGNSSGGHKITFMEQQLNTSTGDSYVSDTLDFAQYNDFYNKQHTIRVYLKEGKPGGNGFVQVKYDDTTVYYRSATLSDTLVGRSDSWQLDWPKFGSVYDFDNRVANNVLADTTSARLRGKKFSLVTTGYNEYTLDTTYSASTISVSHSSVNATAPNFNNGSITLTVSGGTGSYTYQWKKNGINFATTKNLTGLSSGTYNVVVTDTGSNTGTDGATITGTYTPLPISNSAIWNSNIIFR